MYLLECRDTADDKRFGGIPLFHTVDESLEETSDSALGKQLCILST